MSDEIITLILFDALYFFVVGRKLLKKKILSFSILSKFQVQKFEHGRQRYEDSNEDYNLIGNQMEERFEESERKPTMKRIVRHKIENNEVKHPASSNEVDKIFSKDYLKLFKNESSDGSQQNPSESDRVRLQRTSRKGKLSTR